MVKTTEETRGAEAYVLTYSSLLQKRIENFCGELGREFSEEKGKMMASADVLNSSLRSFIKTKNKKLKREILNHFDDFLSCLSGLTSKFEGAKKNKLGTLCADVFSFKEKVEDYFNNVD